MARSRRPKIYTSVSSILTPRKLFRTKLKTPENIVDNKQSVDLSGVNDVLPKHKAKFPLLKKHWTG